MECAICGDPVEEGQAVSPCCGGPVIVEAIYGKKSRTN